MARPGHRRDAVDLPGKQFGPLIVSIDARGDNLFERQKVVYNERKEAALAALNEKVRYIR